MNRQICININIFMKSFGTLSTELANVDDSKFYNADYRQPTETQPDSHYEFPPPELICLK